MGSGQLSFQSLSQLVAALGTNGATAILVKPLAENDNTKQQIYLGPDLSTLQHLPLGAVVSEKTANGSILKASLPFSWLLDDGSRVVAPDAKLIFYPAYPEVRLSGFLRGAKGAPSELLQPVPKADRRGKGPDGRMLVLALTSTRTVVAHLAPADSPVAAELSERLAKGQAERQGVFFRLKSDEQDSRARLIEALRAIVAASPHAAQRLRKGVLESCPYSNPNARGYTLEALLGIEPNGSQDPDFFGWELKTVGRDKVTLLTTEPDGGFYASAGPEAFLRRYGAITNGKLRFVCQHVVGLPGKTTQMMLRLPGFDIVGQRLVDPSQGMVLIDKEGREAASWSYAKMTERWARKHSRTAYVDCDLVSEQFVFGPKVMLCEGTDIQRLLAAFGSRAAYYDPGTSLAEPPLALKKVLKRRNQFRISVRNKAILYDAAETISLTP